MRSIALSGIHAFRITLTKTSFHTFRPCSRRFYAGTQSPRLVCLFSSCAHDTNKAVIIGVYHRVTQNDVYDGYFIPAGSTVIPDVWYVFILVHHEMAYQLMTSRGMLHDPSVFPEPDRFYPERWFSPDVPTFPNEAFGFGARLCPDRFFAHRSIAPTEMVLLRRHLNQGSYRGCPFRRLFK